MFYHYTKEAESSIRYFCLYTSIFIKFYELITKYFSVVQFKICINYINVYLYPLQAFIYAYICMQFKYMHKLYLYYIHQSLISKSISLFNIMNPHNVTICMHAYVLKCQIKQLIVYVHSLFQIMILMF